MLVLGCCVLGRVSCCFVICSVVGWFCGLMVSGVGWVGVGYIGVRCRCCCWLV